MFCQFVDSFLLMCVLVYVFMIYDFMVVEKCFYGGMFLWFLQCILFERSSIISNAFDVQVLLIVDGEKLK